MGSRRRPSVGALALFFAVTAMTAGSAAAQAQSSKAPAAKAAVPHTPWGTPDLQGVWTGSTMTPLERPANLAAKEYLTAEEAVAMEKKAREEQFVDREAPAGEPGTYNQIWFDPSTTLLPDRRTSLIIDPKDGRIPFTPEARKHNTFSRERYGKGPFDTVKDLDTGERCLTDGVPIPYYSGYNNNVHVFQTPQHIVLVGEMYGNRRIIPLSQPREGSIPQWMGRPRGHWEGDTLVVETTNFADKAGDGNWWASAWRAARPTLRMTERFTRVDAETIDYQFTMDDPSMFTRPWTAKFPLTTNQSARGVTVGRLYEYACHEGNHAAENVLSGARAAEKEAKKGTK